MAFKFNGKVSGDTSDLLIYVGLHFLLILVLISVVTCTSSEERRQMDRSYAPSEKVHTNKSKATPTNPEPPNEYSLHTQSDYKKEAVTAPDYLPLPLPKNGYIWRNHRREEIAPFRIVTSPSGDYYYCKLFNLKRNTWTLAVFIHPGKSVSLEVPVGSYELRYAVGDTWYGREHLFGPRTSYYKAEAVLHFQIVGNQVSGYEVQLYPQPHGNLRTCSISPNEWGNDEQGGE